MAAALTVGGRLDAEAATSYESAVDCAGALTMVADRLVAVVSEADAQQVTFARRAADIYLNRAVAAGDDALDKRAVTAEMNRRIKEKQSQIGSQSQLAIACLRALQRSAQAS